MSGGSNITKPKLWVTKSKADRDLASQVKLDREVVKTW